MRIIVNADDLGKDAVVNSAIKIALDKGIISSSTIMANTAFMDQVCNIVKEHPEASFGLHLNITEGPSITRNEVLSDYHLIKDDGNFDMEHNLNMIICDDKELQDAIEKEWSAQIEILLDNGIKPTHIDGHQHCHSWYGFSIPLYNICEKYKIYKVRNVYNQPLYTIKESLLSYICRLLINIESLNAFRYSSKSYLNQVLRAYQAPQFFNKIAARSGWNSPTKFTSVEKFLSIISKYGVNAISDNGVMELMCHPGHPRYEKEFMQMLNRDYLKISGIQLTNYKDI